MQKYLIMWDAGYGRSYEVIEAASQKEADEAAYQQWIQEAESNADHEAQVLTRELAEQYDFEHELEGE
ncbi:hypothetical protein [Parasphingopyxis sp.]|uniref:hypothetical protein n=1 Tax=Parasphingopyxis sp. TaxID=1920299 RepID=UPI00260BFA14|nr:hypothetical protein [Parasphingopyxis sp.]